MGLDPAFTHLPGAHGRPTIAISCDFDAVQCAVSGPDFCESFGGIGEIPEPAGIVAALDRWLASTGAAA